MADPATSPRAPGAPAKENRGRSLYPVLREHVHGGVVAFVATALVLTLMSWPVTSLAAGAGLDPSWVTALHMAVNDGLHFGPDVVFSFGPLGFLRVPNYAFAWTTRASFAYTLVIQLGLCLALLWAVRRNVGSLLPAAPVVLVIATVVYAEPVPVLAFAVAVALVRGEVPPRLLPAIQLAMGALVAVQLLAKLNVGVTVAALAAIALLSATQRRRAQVLAFAAGLLVGCVAGWLLSGQSAGAVTDYLRASLQVISGYSESMMLATPGDQWELWAALALAVIGALLILRADLLDPFRVKLGMLALWLVLAFTSFKAGFVRHEVNHANVFFAVMLGGLVALPMRGLPRSTATLLVLFATLALLASLRVAPTDLIDPLGRPDAFASQARTLADGSATNRAIVRARERVAEGYALDPQIVTALRGHSVHVDPHDTNVAWAYRLAWKPVPVFQEYVAYTRDLDARNAAAFASADGPERVLRHMTSAVDGRNPAWESPAAMRAMLCHFRAVVAVPPWQVLERTPNRCGAPRLLREARARLGASIAVPAPPSAKSLVYMRIDGIQVRGLERLRALFFRALPRFVGLDGRRQFRLVPGTAGDGLTLRVGSTVDYPVPLNLDQDVSSLTITRGTGKQPDREVGVRFYSMDVR
jgi:hypothetical protein